MSSKHYYAARYDNNSSEPCEIICYHSDSFSDDEVREAYNTETRPWFWSGYQLRKVRVRDLPKVLRSMWPYMYGRRDYKVRFTEYTNSSQVVFARAAAMYHVSERW